MDKPKRGPGRPPIADPEDQRFEIRVSKGRLARYSRAAAKKDLPVGTWAKGVLDKAAPK